MAKKKSDNNTLRPNGAASPPDMERNWETGQYTVDKREALKNWFDSARTKACSQSIAHRNIDPKQVIYGNYTEDKKKK